MQISISRGNPSGASRRGDRLLAVILAVSSFIFLGLALLSLHWRLGLDSPIFLYIAFLMDRFHSVPYRDIFDVNPPGAYFLNWGIGKILGYDDFAYRIADLVYLAAVLATTAGVMKKFGWKVAWAGSVIFGLLYLGYGPAMSLERDYLLVLPLALALWVSTCLPRLPAPVKGAATGLLFGLAAFVKPQAAMALPIFLVYQWLESRPAAKLTPLPLRRLGLFLGAALAGLAVPLAAGAWYLADNGAWPYFREMVLNYWPLYNQLTRTRQVLSGTARVLYLVRGWLSLGQNPAWLFPALFGSVVSLAYAGRSAPEKRIVGLLLALTVCFSLYPVIPGKFFFYHWILFYYCAILLGALGFVRGSRWSALEPVLLAVLLLLTVVGHRTSDSAPGGPRKILRQAAGLVLHPRATLARIGAQTLAPPKGGRVDEIAAYLKLQLQPGDRVQALDWTGGALQAMLLARAQPATPFLYDVEFYHHVSHPYIQDLRRRFIADLQLSPPRFIVEVEAADKPFVQGPDTTATFPELREILQRDYAVAWSEEDFRIYRRK